jgi:MtN3 and saliva related transmembrane protein
MLTDVIGWVSSAILLLTIGSQIYKQYKEDSAKGVSRWLFVGQLSASLGFFLYSVMLGNWVFIFTNSLMVISALIGFLITVRFKRREARRGEAA